MAAFGYRYLTHVLRVVLLVSTFVNAFEGPTRWLTLGLARVQGDK